MQSRFVRLKWAFAALLAALVETAAAKQQLGDWALWPDSIEYLAIGHSWANGAGFVDPVQWYYLPTAETVLPAFAVRAPLVPALLGLGFRSGATVLTMVQMHAIWSCLVVGLIVLGAGRVMRLPAALATALWIGTMPSWVVLTRLPMTETTATAVFVAVLATARAATRSVGGALLCASLTLVAWGTRPNFAGMAVAVFVAALFSSERRRLAPWVYLLAFVSGYIAISWLAVSQTGWAPYAGYAALARHVDGWTVYAYSFTRPESFFALVVSDPIGVLTAAGRNGAALLEELFVQKRFRWVGWVAAPGIVWCLWGGLRSRLERRICALCALGFSLGVMLTLGYWSPDRYPLPVAVAGAFCALALVDDLCTLAERRLPTGLARRGFALLPPLLVLVLFVGADASRLLVLDPWPLRDVQSKPINRGENEDAMALLCRHIPRDVLVASADPWSITMWCANPAIKLPGDFYKRRQRNRFLEERGPRYVVINGRYPAGLARGPVYLEPMLQSGPYTLHRVQGAPPRPLGWRAPSPLACAGQPAACAESVGR